MPIAAAQIRKMYEKLFSPLRLRGGKTLINRALMGSVCAHARAACWITFLGRPTGKA